LSAIDEVRERTDIVELVSAYFPLQKAGRNFKALCPFHKEKTPSFIVFPDGQRWHCFGACAAGGDTFTFVMKMENLEFGEALRFLARRAGISLAPRREEEVEGEKRKRLLLRINAAAAQYFHHLLRESPEGGLVREYLARREIEPTSIEAFQLGYALDEWEALKRYLAERGYEETDIFAAGLAVERVREDLERKGGGYYDRFRGRLIFPIRDIRGEVIGFGARSLDDSQPKYLNSPETPLFSKGRVLYGIDLAKRAIREKDQVIIVEGYTDVITAHQRGFRNVVASMGTALTENHVRELKRLTKRFVLALDADKAGDAATRRGLEVATEIFRDSVVPVPLGRNLIRYEARLDADIRIAILPEGRDPDDVLREGAGLWAELVERALPVVDYYFSLISSRLDLSSAKGKSAAANELLPIIEELGDEVEKSHYLQKLARLIKVDEKRLLLETEPKRSVEPQEKRGGLISGFPGFLLGVEKRLLLLFLEEPRRMKRVDEELEEVGSEPLAPQDFEDIENREIFSALRGRLSERILAGQEGGVEEPWDLERFRAELDAMLQERFAHLLDLRSRISVLAERGGDWEAVLCALRLQEDRLQREMETLHFLERDAEEEKDRETLMQLARVTSERKDEVRRVKKARYEKSLMRRSRGKRPWEGSWLVEA
jgi:DNA primase